jgi:hypothetical protein
MRNRTALLLISLCLTSFCIILCNCCSSMAPPVIALCRAVAGGGGGYVNCNNVDSDWYWAYSLLQTTTTTGTGLTRSCRPQPRLVLGFLALADHNHDWYWAYSLLQTTTTTGTGLTRSYRPQPRQVTVTGSSLVLAVPWILPASSKSLRERSLELTD